MSGIERLEPGAKILLGGYVPAVVEDNPRDGSWIVVRYSRALNNGKAATTLKALAENSEHGMILLPSIDSTDAILVVHAEDVWPYPPSEE